MGTSRVYGADSTVHARTTNGNVRLELSRRMASRGQSQKHKRLCSTGAAGDSQADLEARLNGNFLPELPMAMQGSLKPRKCAGNLGKVSANQLHTVNGGIRVVALRTQFERSGIRAIPFASHRPLTVGNFCFSSPFGPDCFSEKIWNAAYRQEAVASWGSAGGRSGEHEVSLASAASVIARLDPDKYEAVPIGISAKATG
jgi:hypothetical protein